MYRNMYIGLNQFEPTSLFGWSGQYMAQKSLQSIPINTSNDKWVTSSLKSCNKDDKNYVLS